MEPFAYAAVVQFVTSLTGMLAFTPNTVLATESTPPEFKTMAYAVFLVLSTREMQLRVGSRLHRGSLAILRSKESTPRFYLITTACQLGALTVPFLRDAPLAA